VRAAVRLSCDFHLKLTAIVLICFLILQGQQGSTLLSEEVLLVLFSDASS
jgi:hypothetical protein